MNHFLFRHSMRVAALSAFFLCASVALADHSHEEETTIHATTVKTSPASVSVTPTYAPVVHVEEIQRMQALLKALQELVMLLQHQKEHELDEHNNSDHE